MPSTQPDATTMGGNGLIRVINSLDVVFLRTACLKSLFSCNNLQCRAYCVLGCWVLPRPTCCYLRKNPGRPYRFKESPGTRDNNSPLLYLLQLHSTAKSTGAKFTIWLAEQTTKGPICLLSMSPVHSTNLSHYQTSVPCEPPY